MGLQCRTTESGTISKLTLPLSKAQSLVATSSFHDWIPEERASESGRRPPEESSRGLTFPGLSRLGHVTESISEIEPL
jgi:hypothetical protein